MNTEDSQAPHLLIHLLAVFVKIHDPDEFYNPNIQFPKTILSKARVYKYYNDNEKLWSGTHSSDFYRILLCKFYKWQWPLEIL